MICDSCKNGALCALGDKEPESENRCADYVSETMTHEDAREIIRLLRRIDQGIQHLECSLTKGGIIWKDYGGRNE